MVEQLGFIVLAKAKGHHQKVSSYKKSFENLIKTIELVRDEYKDVDRKRDLTVIHKKATYLYDFVKSTL